MTTKTLPKAQPYPATKIFVGAVLYSAYSYETATGIETGIDEWVVRTIRARRNSTTRYGVRMVPKGLELAKRVNLVQKNDRTWGKVSKKTGDYGWQKSLPDEFRRQFAVGSDLPFGIYTTQRALLVFRLACELSRRLASTSTLPTARTRRKRPSWKGIWLFRFGRSRLCSAD